MSDFSLDYPHGDDDLILIRFSLLVKLETGQPDFEGLKYKVGIAVTALIGRTSKSRLWNDMNQGSPSGNEIRVVSGKPTRSESTRQEFQNQLSILVEKQSPYSGWERDLRQAGYSVESSRPA